MSQFCKYMLEKVWIFPTNPSILQKTVTILYILCSHVRYICPLRTGKWSFSEPKVGAKKEPRPFSFPYPSQEKNEEDPNQCVCFSNSHFSSSFYFYSLDTIPALFPMERWEWRFGRPNMQKDTLLRPLQLDPSLKPSESKTWSQRGGPIDGEQHSGKCNWHTELHWGAD